MQKIIYSLLLLSISFGNIFISEYSEGSSNNKYIEIYNGSTMSVDLSSYSIKLSRNGAGWGMYDETTNESGFVQALSGNLVSGDVYILAADQADGTILSSTDLPLSYPSVCHFNGNDAIGLFQNDQLIDVVGNESEDPGEDNGWTIAGTSDATKEYTIVRKASVVDPNTDWVQSAGSTVEDSEWIVYAQNTWAYVGFHIMGDGGENVAPIANAGADQSVLFGTTVMLDGSLSVDPDGSIISYEWTQIEGETVSITNNNQSSASFLAPNQEASFSFSLSVVDDNESSDLDTVLINVSEGLSNKVFFSEYAEGTSNNKYLEIYNGTEDPVDLSNYALSSCSNGCGGSPWDYVNNVEFVSGTIVQPGDVYVVCNGSAEQIILDNCDQTFTYLSNGDDAFAIVDAVTGDIMDIIGDTGDDPGEGWVVAGVADATKEHTLERKSSVEFGNTDWESSAGTDASNSEWIVHDQNYWDGLGVHSQNTSAPVVSILSVTPDFITDASEIVLTASITSPIGDISTAKIMYGTGNQLLNEVTMYFESGTQWVGTVPTQLGNQVFSMKVIAEDNQGFSGQSTIFEKLIASSNIKDISEIQGNVVPGNIETIEGVITIGTGLLTQSTLKAYIQDQSGRGICVFDFNYSDDFERGDMVHLVGYVEQYQTTIELVDYEYHIVSTDNPIPAQQEINSSQANSSVYEGSLISFPGEITMSEIIGENDGLKLTVDGIAYVMIWNSTGVNTSGFTVGSTWNFLGIGSQFNEDYQLLVAYDDDIQSLGIEQPSIIIDQFSVLPAYPNPFNPQTVLSFYNNRVNNVNVKVYDISGRLVNIIADKKFSIGRHSLFWNASSFPSGVYFIHVNSGEDIHTQKIMLIK